MAPPTVLVVGETPSLGRSIADLLESNGIATRFVLDIGGETPLGSLGKRFPVVIAACNRPFCGTARRWIRGEFPHTQLVVVGSRDPTLGQMAGVTVVPLPLLPRPFVSLASDLLAGLRPTARPLRELAL
ncbi:MAG TPA: hypothetical protein VMG36_06305 [Thermoplasmata archaeon]|nr:hypothetical protein [Thermoplasmata archaeon]